MELPLTHPEYYEEMGIRPPKGVILYGEPGTGKTLLAKAVANQTSATFLRVVGSELIQKYLVSKLLLGSVKAYSCHMSCDRLRDIGSLRCLICPIMALLQC